MILNHSTAVYEKLIGYARRIGDAELELCAYRAKSAGSLPFRDPDLAPSIQRADAALAELARAHDRLQSLVERIVQEAAGHEWFEWPMASTDLLASTEFDLVPEGLTRRMIKVAAGLESPAPLLDEGEDESEGTR